MNTEIMKFTHPQFGQIRTMVMPDGQVGFVGKDVAMVLGYAKPQNALAAHVDPEDKTTAPIQGTGSNYKTKAVVINESGLYSLILSSKLPNARRFKHWVTSEVIPEIRRTGGYSPHGVMSAREMMAMMQQPEAVMVLCKTIIDLDGKVQELQNSLREMNVMYRSPSGCWMLYAPYLKRGYEAYRTKRGANIFGDTTWTDTYLVWTERGKRFIHGLFC